MSNDQDAVMAIAKAQLTQSPPLLSAPKNKPGPLFTPQGLKLFAEGPV